MKEKSPAIISCVCFDVVLLRQDIGYLKSYEERPFAESFCIAVPATKIFQLYIFVFSAADSF